MAPVCKWQKTSYMSISWAVPGKANRIPEYWVRDQTWPESGGRRHWGRSFQTLLPHLQEVRRRPQPGGTVPALQRRLCRASGQGVLVERVHGRPDHLQVVQEWPEGVGKGRVQIGKSISPGTPAWLRTKHLECGWLCCWLTYAYFDTSFLLNCT